MFLDSLDESFVLVIAQHSLFLKGIAIILNVLLELIQASLGLVSGRLKEVVDVVLWVTDIDLGSLDVQIQHIHWSIVLIWSASEISIQLLQLLLQIITQSVNCFDQFLLYLDSYST